MKKFEKIVLIAIALLTALIINFACYPLWVNISNYENLLPPSGSIEGIKTLISGIPLYMFIASIISIIFFSYKQIFLGKDNPFARKHYALLVIIFSGIGFVGSIVNGAWVYRGNFFGPYMFMAYPFVMMIVDALLIGISIYFMIPSLKEIKENNLVKTEKSSVGHIFFTLGEVVLTLFALGRLGAFLTQPIYWSKYDSIYVLPYIIQLLAPVAILVCYLLYRDVFKNKKFGLIATISILAYSVLSLIYFAVLVKVCEAGTHAANSTIYINPLSQIQNPGRLLTGPINETIMYVVSIGFPVLNLAIFGIKKLVAAIKK